MGGMLRFAIGHWVLTRWPVHFMLPTLFVNVMGSFLVGAAWAWLHRGQAAPWAAPLFVSGFLGGFTTFSALSLEVFRLWEEGRTGLAIAYGLGSPVLGLLACALGFFLVRAVG